jgi:hypothetical protein
MTHNTSTLQSGQAFRWTPHDVVVMEEFLQKNDINDRAALHAADTIPLIDDLFTHKYYGLITDNGETVMSIVDKKVVNKLEDILRKRGHAAGIDHPFVTHMQDGASGASNQQPATRMQTRAAAAAAALVASIAEKSVEESDIRSDNAAGDPYDHPGANHPLPVTPNTKYKSPSAEQSGGQSACVPLDQYGHPRSVFQP